MIDLQKLTKHKEQLRRHFRINGKWVRQAAESYAFEAGEQWSKTDAALMAKRGRAAFVANLVRPHINMICGYAISSPYEPDFLPRGQGDDDICRVLKGITNWVKDTTGYPRAKERSFRDKVICGRGFRWWDWDFDFESQKGKIRCQRVSPFSVYWDPESTESDFSDADFIGRLMWMTKNELKERYHDKDVEIDKAFADYLSEENQSEAIDRRIWFSAETKRIRVVEHWYRSQRTETVHKVGNQLLRLDELDDIGRAAASAGLVKTRRVKRQEIRISVFINSVMLEDIASPYQHGRFPLIQDSGYASEARDAQEEIDWVEPVGVVHDLKDIQRELNKARSMGMEYLNKGLNSKYLAPQGTLTPEDMAALRDSGTKNDVVIQISGDPSRLREVSPPSIPIAVAEMEQRNRQDFREISGYNEQTLGGAAVSGSASGRALQIKQQQAVMQIAYLLKNTYYSECEDLKLLWGDSARPGLIPQFLSDEQVLRIAAEDGGMEDIPLQQGLPAPKVDVPNYENGEFVLKTFYDLTKFEFDIVINNSPQTPTSRMAALYALNDAISANPALAQMVPPQVYLDLLDIPGLRQRVREQQEAMQQAQMQAAQAQVMPGQQMSPAEPRGPTPNEQMAGMPIT